MGDFNAGGHTKATVGAAVSNGIPPPNFTLPLPDNPDTITANLLLLVEQTPNPRHRFIYQNLVKRLHAFVRETNLSTDEWMAAIQFLTRAGQKCTSIRQEVTLLSSVLGVTAIIGALNNPVEGGATENSLLGPFHTDDAKDVGLGESIASEGKGEYMYVEGRVLTTEGEPIANAVIDTWEADLYGLYDTQYSDRTHPDCRGKLRTGKDGRFAYRAVVPPSYSIPDDGPVGELLLSQGRHNMRPSHLHIMVEAPGYHTLVTAFFPEGGGYVDSDAVFGVKKSLLVKLEQIDDEEEARKRGFSKGSSFKLLKRDIILLTEERSLAIRQRAIKESEELYLQDKNV